jgi:hypothetical protein
VLTGGHVGHSRDWVTDAPKTRSVMESEAVSRWSRPPFLRLYEEEQCRLMILSEKEDDDDSNIYVVLRFFATIKGFHEVSVKRLQDF